MIRFVLVAALFVGMCAPAHSNEQEVFFRTSPGGATVFEIGSDGEREVARSTGDDAVSEYHWSADTEVPHQVHLVRPPFNDLYLVLTWSSDMGRWKLSMQDVEDYLQSGDQLDFSRSFQLNVFPADADVFMDAVAGGATVARGRADGQTLTIAGNSHAVVPLPRDGRGFITVPSAWKPGPIFVTRTLYEPAVVQFPEGALGAPDALLPQAAVTMRGIYGPFSDVKTDLMLGTALIVGLVCFVRFGMPVLRQRSADRTRDELVARRVLAGAALGDAMLGRRIRGESGETFVILSRLGEGASGIVYEAARATDARGAGEKWACKILRGEPDEAFMREVRVLSGLHHPGLVKIQDWGRFHPDDASAAHPFIIMEQVEGSTLREVFRNSQPLAVAQVTRWIGDVLRALKTAHAARIVHRDLKPENLMLTARGHVKILDFGVAQQISIQSDAAGTHLYMAPELLEGKEIGPAADIYAVGVIAYELLAGQPPFTESDPWQLLARIHRERPMPLSSLRPDVNVAFAQLIARMLDPDPARRPQGADEAIREAAEPLHS